MIGLGLKSMVQLYVVHRRHTVTERHKYIKAKEWIRIQPLWKTDYMQFPYNPAMLPLSKYPREIKTFIHIETHPWMFIAALFMIAKREKQLRCPADK